MPRAYLHFCLIQPLLQRLPLAHYSIQKALLFLPAQATHQQTVSRKWHGRPSFEGLLNEPSPQALVAPAADALLSCNRCARLSLLLQSCHFTQLLHMPLTAGCSRLRTVCAICAACTWRYSRPAVCACQPRADWVTASGVVMPQHGLILGLSPIIAEPSSWQLGHHHSWQSAFCRHGVSWLCS